MAIRVFNADDHPMLRKGITDLISESHDLEWVGSGENGQEAYEKISAIKPDVAILDIEMPKMTGLEVVEKLLAEGSDTKFIIMTLFKEESFFKNALSIGVHGYLLKESSEKEILECIHQVVNGRKYVNSSLSYLLMNQAKEEDSLLDSLSTHEKNILKLIAKQKTTAEIADMLFISPKTVSNHRNNISKKLHLEGKQNGLLKWALEHKSSLGV